MERETYMLYYAVTVKIIFANGSILCRIVAFHAMECCKQHAEFIV